MIWLLLYPLRGTSNPPIITDFPPIRRAFQKHGLIVSTYWLWSLFVSVLICVTVLYTFFIGSPAFSTLPGHGWTYANTFDSGHAFVEDVSVRRVWIHGDHMGALEPHVLQDALQIQNALMYDQFPSDRVDGRQVSRAPTNSCQSSTTDATMSWGFHSPLMYWNCSRKAMLEDKDRLLTIQQGSDLHSYWNLTLLPSSVFSGKTFAGKKLTEADALVITHFDTAVSHGATKWDARLVKLAAEYGDRWLFYPPSGVMATNQLYEYEREPITSHQIIGVGFIYFMISMFTVYRLQDAPAVRSRLGLIAAMITEMAISIIASFSICSLLQIDLSRVPRELYPFVVIVMGIENMLRLVNAALDQPPQTEPTKRIETAMAKAGHISLASTTQILFALWTLSRIVSSSIQAFCIFVGFAILFDFCFHLIFFVTVLSVDVQRMELQDSLDRAESKGAGHRLRKTQPWFDALMTGKLPLTSRVLGSVISICFVLGLNMHITDLETFIKAVWDRTVEWIPGRKIKSALSQDLLVPPYINQARTPQEWLRLQDHQFAQEVIDAIKPGARSMIARVYEPVIIVLKGSDRGLSPAAQGLLRRTWVIMNQHILPVLFIISVFIGLLGPLMDYLLWDNRTDEEKEAELREKHAISHIRKLPIVHSMDIYRLASNDNGHIVAVGLDRSLISYMLNLTLQKYEIDAAPVPHDSDVSLWPVAQIALDETGQYIAVCSSLHHIGIWNRSQQTWIQLQAVTNLQSSPRLMAFAKLDDAEARTTHLVMVVHDGSVILYDIAEDRSTTSSLSCTVVSAVLAQNGLGLHILCLSQSKQVHSLLLSSSLSPSSTRHLSSFNDSSDTPIRSLRYVAALNIVALIRPESVSLVDFSTGLQISQVFLGKKVMSSSIRIMHSNAKECRNCRSPAVYSLSLAYTEAQTRDCVIETFTATEGEHPLICLHPTTNSAVSSCQSIEYCHTAKKVVPQPGQWEATGQQTIVGIRSISSAVETIRGKSFNQARSSALNGADSPSLRRRLLNSSPDQSSDQGAMSFEIWTLSPSTEFYTMPVSFDKDDLWVPTPGPIVPLGARSIAVAIGNSVRVITVGSDRIEGQVAEVWTGGTVANGKPKVKELKKRKPGIAASKDGHAMSSYTHGRLELR